MENYKIEGKISLVQPNKVTNSRHDFNEKQENILTLMIEAIQKHMSKDEYIQTDLFGQPMITLDFDTNGLRKRDYWESAKEMKKKEFEFDYINPDGKKEDVNGVLVTTVRKIDGENKIEITINAWAIPYLIYWGKGVGGTIFNKVIALTIPGQHAKRMYKLCKRWENKGGFGMPISEFRYMMKLEDSYPTNGKLKTLLERCKEALDDHADVYFKFSMEKKGGGRSFNFINFYVKGNNKNRPTAKKTDMYSAVYTVLCYAYDRMKSSKAQEIADKLANNPSDLESFYYRTKRLMREYHDGVKSMEEIVKLVKYILKNDYNF